MAVVQDLTATWSSGADDEAFDALYRQHKVALLAFCRSRLADAGDAEDACQEAFLRAYRASDRFDRAQRPWPWLATIAANVCTDMRRRTRPVPLSACGDDIVGGTVDPDHDAEARAKVSLVSTAIRDLPEAYRRPVHLADVEGWSYGDIAAHERKSVSSVRSSLMRGRVAFKVRVQALAEERGMWPLSAALPPFVRSRNRFLAWRSSSETLSTIMPNSFSLAQAAAATLAALSTMVPSSGAAAAEDVRTGPPSPATTSEVVPARLSLVEAPDGETGSHATGGAGVEPADDLAADARGVVVDSPRTDPNDRRILEVTFDCESEVRGHVCRAFDALPPRPNA